MSEDRSVLYKIRWEILVMAVSLILSAVVVVVIPHDFSAKLIEENKEKKEMEKKLELQEGTGLNETVGKGNIPIKP